MGTYTVLEIYIAALLTPLQPIAVRHGVVKARPVNTFDGLVAVNDLEHLTDEGTVLLCSILHAHSNTQRLLSG